MAKEQDYTRISMITLQEAQQVIKFKSLCFTDIGNASFLNIKPVQFSVTRGDTIDKIELEVSTIDKIELEVF